MLNKPNQAPRVYVKYIATKVIGMDICVNNFGIVWALDCLFRKIKKGKSIVIKTP